MFFNYALKVVVEKLDSLGDSITTAVVSSWSKEVGDKTKEDDVICVVETDKVTMEIRAKRSGVFVEALVAAGKEVYLVLFTYNIGSSFISITTVLIVSGRGWSRFIQD